MWACRSARERSRLRKLTIGKANPAQVLLTERHALEEQRWRRRAAVVGRYYQSTVRRRCTTVTL